MKLTDVTEKTKQPLTEANIQQKALLNLHGINAAGIDNFEEFSAFVNRQQDINPTLYRKIVSLD